MKCLGMASKDQYSVKKVRIQEKFNPSWYDSQRKIDKSVASKYRLKRDNGILGQHAKDFIVQNDLGFLYLPLCLLEKDYLIREH